MGGASGGEEFPGSCLEDETADTFEVVKGGGAFGRVDVEGVSDFSAAAAAAAAPAAAAAAPGVGGVGVGHVEVVEVLLHFPQFNGHAIGH